MICYLQDIEVAIIEYLDIVANQRAIYRQGLHSSAVRGTQSVHL